MKETIEVKDWWPLFPRYRGQWVALADDEVTVVAAPTAKGALSASTSKGEPMPILYRVPETLDTFVGYESLRIRVWGTASESGEAGGAVEHLTGSTWAV